MNAADTAERARASSVSEVDWVSAYSELLPRVYHYFCLRTGDPSEAEDLTATVFERAWRGRSRFRHDLGTFSAWLFGIARHVVVEHYRQSKTNTSNFGNQDVGHSRPTEDAAEQREAFARLASRLAVLPKRQRELFALKYGARLSNRAIASALNMTETNVSTVLHRLVTRIREEMGAK